MDYKLITDTDDILFENYTLSEGMTVKVKNRKKAGDNFITTQLLNHVLRDYGFTIALRTSIRNTAGKEQDIIVNGCGINENFPVENEPLFKQLYAWDNALINIMFYPGDKNNEDCAFSFDYNLDTFECELQLNHYGSSYHRRKFETLGEMLSAIKEVEKMQELFEMEEA